MRFNEILLKLRKERKITQRQASAALNISQALLSHYEHGVREPGLAFVRKACDYYGVSADYLLGRTDELNGVKTGNLRSKGIISALKKFSPTKDK